MMGHTHFIVTPFFCAGGLLTPGQKQIPGAIENEPIPTGSELTARQR